MVAVRGVGGVASRGCEAATRVRGAGGWERWLVVGGEGGVGVEGEAGVGEREGERAGEGAGGWHLWVWG